MAPPSVQSVDRNWVGVRSRPKTMAPGGTREALLPANVTLGPDGVRVRGTTPLNLKDYEIGGLTKMMGMLKMHEEIVVHVDLVFEPAAASASQAGATMLVKPIAESRRY